MKKISPAKAWIRDYTLQVSRYVTYCESNDWKESPNDVDGYTAQQDICEFLLGRIKHLMEKYPSYLKYKYVQDFRDKMLSPVVEHLNRCRDYIKNNDFSQIPDDDLRSSERVFQQGLMGDFNKLKDRLQSLNLDDEVSSLELPIRADEKIPFLMWELAEVRFPEIVEYKESMGIGSFDIQSVKTSPEMFINMKDPPKYDNSLHYYEQSKDVQQFFSEELHKITFGLNINGVFMHPWLYWHANYMKTDIPMEFFKGTPKYNPAKKVLITNTVLRDNEWFMAETYREAEEQNVGIFGFGTRRFGKTIFETSILTWRTTIIQNSESIVIGGDTGDLKKLSKSLEMAFTHVNPAFKLPRNNSDWSSHIQFGLKDKSGQRIPYSDIFIKNVHDGKNKGTEKTAGATPTAWILDEAGKFNCKSVYQAALPSFQNVGGWALVPILTGTGGNKKLSADAQDMLLRPRENDILPMNWDRLENMVKEEELITWKRKSFGTFLPAQFSFKSGMRKNISNLADFYGVDDDKLRQIEIRVTDWEKARNVLQADRERKKEDKVVYAKEKMYYPIDPLECFLNRIDNPFPAVEAQVHRDELILSGKVGKYVDVYLDKETNKMEMVMSEKDPASFPFKGGTYSAPVVVFNDPPEYNESDGTYVAGLDHYKQDKSNTDSLGAFYVFKRGVDLSPWSYRIVASYVSRPPTMDMFNKVVETVMKGYGAEVLQENVDISFQQHLERNDEAAKWLAHGDDLVRTLISARSQQNNKYGLFPSARNQRYLLQLVISYCQEDIVIGQDDSGNDIKVKGVTRIPDVQLLDEIIAFDYTGNFDRIVSFGHALAWDRYLTRIGVLPKVRQGVDYRKKEKEKKPIQPSFISKRRTSPYSRKR